jgi:hypothetical protein
MVLPGKILNFCTVQEHDYQIKLIAGSSGSTLEQSLGFPTGNHRFMES